MKINYLLAITVVFTMTGCKSMPSDSSQQQPLESIANNKEIVTDFFKNFSNGNIESAFSLVSENANWWVAGDLPFSGTKTKTEYLQIVGAIKQGFPNGLQLNVTSMIAEEKKVAVEVASLGDHVSGKTYTNKYHFLITIEDGQMVEIKEYMDTLHLYQLIQP